MLARSLAGVQLEFSTLTQFMVPCLGNGATNSGFSLSINLIQTTPQTRPKARSLVADNPPLRLFSGDL